MPLLEQLATLVAEAAAAPKGKNRAEIDPFPAIDPWDDPVDAAQLLDGLCELILEYVVLPKHAVEAIALWILHTYLLDVADYTPYLLVTSPVRECGKSTLLDILVHLAYRAQLSGGITAAALYRRIDRHSPSMLLDELDTRLRGDGGELLRGVLNTGFSRSGRITVCVGDDHEDRDFSTFGPKVLAGIGRMWDTVTSRSIPLRLQRASKAQMATLTKVKGHRIAQTCLPFCRQLRRVSDDCREEVRNAEPTVPSELSARQSDVWRPLFAIADFAGGRWPVDARSAARALHGVAEEEGDYGLLMLRDVHDLFVEQNADVLSTAYILNALNEREDRPWPEYRNGRALTPRGLADLMGRFSARPKTLRVNGTTAKGYERVALQSAFDTYLQQTPGHLSVTSVTSAHVTDVTDKNEGVGSSVAYDPRLASQTAAFREIDRDGTKVRQRLRPTAHGDRWFDDSSAGRAFATSQPDSA